MTDAALAREQCSRRLISATHSRRVCSCSTRVSLMASAPAQELKEALRDALERNGSLGDIKARLRAEVYNSLHGDALPKPQPSNDNMIINELIREYLIFNGYRETLSVFIPETGQPTIRPFERAFLVEHLNLVDGPNSKQLPLLYNLVATVGATNARQAEEGQGGGPSSPGAT